MDLSTAAKEKNLKVPPHSIDAEQAVLGGLMLDHKAWDLIADRLMPEHFYRPQHQKIFRAMIQLSQQSQPLDLITVSEKLESLKDIESVGGLAYLGELAQNTPSAANILAYADIVSERAILRELIAIGAEMTEVACNPDGRSSHELLDLAERRVFEIAEKGNRKSGPEGIKSVISRAIDKIEQRYQNGNLITGIATGFSDFDKMTSGLQPGDFVIVAGRPSMGKTTFAMNIAEHAAIRAQKTVLVFSMEMPADSLAMRMLSSLGRIDQHHLRTGKLVEDDWTRLTNAVGWLSKAKMVIDETGALSPMDLRARARRVARDHQDLGLIVIDYLQLMHVAGRSENRTAEISEISRALKALAKELSVPVIALSQLNRSLEQRPNKRPVMSDLRECVTGDTLVCLADGRRIPIKSLVGTTPDVLAMDSNQKIMVAKSDCVWSKGIKPIYKLITASGRILRATKEHRVYVDGEWKTFEDLSVGDRIATARCLPSTTTQIWSDAEIILLAHLIGDGSYIKRQPLRYTTASEENSQLVKECAQFLGSTVSRSEGPTGTWHQLIIAGNGNRWHPKGVGAWLKNLGVFGQRSIEKRIPEGIFQLPLEKLALFLRHLWATDGCIYIRKDSKSGARVYFSTCSEKLARDVQALLLRLGILTRLRALIQKTGNPIWSVDVSGAEQQLKFLDVVGAFGPKLQAAQTLKKHLLEIVSNTNVDTLPQKIFQNIKQEMQQQGISQRAMAGLRGTSYAGSSHFSFSPSRAVVEDYADLLDSTSLKEWARSDLFWDTIIAVEPDGVEEVFDLTVPGPASWLADGLVSHNSGAIEQDADLIVFIYRDEVYNEESDSKGVAEIIIGKQRNGPIGTLRLTFSGKYTRFDNFVGQDAFQAD